MKRKIKKADVTFLSLVPRGANRLPVAYKSEDATHMAAEIDLLTVKADKFEDTGEILAVAYPKGLRDSQGDVVETDEAIKSMVESFAANGMKLDVRHNEKALDKSQALVTQSFIVQKGDARFADLKTFDGQPADATGSWAVAIKIQDPDLRAKFRAGEFQGVSFGGRMEVEAEKTEESEASLVARCLEFLKSLKPYSSLYTSVGDTRMSLTKEETAAIAAKAASDAVAAYKAEQEAVTKAAADKAAAEAAAKKAEDDKIAAAVAAGIEAYKADEAKKAADAVAQTFPPTNQQGGDDVIGHKADFDYEAAGRAAAEAQNKRTGRAK